MANPPGAGEGLRVSQPEPAATPVSNDPDKFFEDVASRESWKAKGKAPHKPEETPPTELTPGEKIGARASVMGELFKALSRVDPDKNPEHYKRLLDAAGAIATLPSPREGPISQELFFMPVLDRANDHTAKGQHPDKFFEDVARRESWGPQGQTPTPSVEPPPTPAPPAAPPPPTPIV